MTEKEPDLFCSECKLKNLDYYNFVDVFVDIVEKRDVRLKNLLFKHFFECENFKRTPLEQLLLYERKQIIQRFTILEAFMYQTRNKSSELLFFQKGDSSDEFDSDFSDEFDFNNSNSS